MTRRAAKWTEGLRVARPSVPRAASTYMLAVLVAAGMSRTASAQWIKQPTPDIPRTTDREADLSAPAPRLLNGMPDLSGLWQMNPGSYVVNMAQDLAPSDIQPWAQARFTQHVDEFAKDPGCFLPSGPRYYITGMPKIIHTPKLVVVLNEDLTYRQIFMDGRGLPTDPNPAYMGYSVGRWEGDALVVQSTGFNERTLLDTGGHPHTESLRITERFHRIDFGHMDLQVTFEDPAVYAKPMVVPVRMQLVPDDDLIEYVCRENEKDYQHIVGRASDHRQQLPAAVLSSYVGAYEVQEASGPTGLVINVTLEAGELVVDRTPWIRGKSREPLIPVSRVGFIAFFGRQVHFVTDDHGTATQLVFEAPEPPLRDVVAIKEWSGSGDVK